MSAESAGHRRATASLSWGACRDVAACHHPLMSFAMPPTLFLAVALVVAVVGLPATVQGQTPTSERSVEVTARVAPELGRAIEAEHGVALGSEAYLRAFKDERVLEAWLRGPQGWVLVRSWPICALSGTLGPKLAEGDLQVPEGFYSIVPGRLNPRSSYHLSMNVGYPNAYDRAHGRTGSYIMIHGVCGSSGCLAMTDPIVEEVWVLVEAALQRGQREVPVHLFPFRMTPERLAAESEHPWFAFWEELEPAYTLFETEGVPPRARVRDARYVVDSGQRTDRARR